MAEKKQDQQAGSLYWVRITLTCQAVKPLEKVAAEVKSRAKDKNLKLKGPIRLPTKVRKPVTYICCRPCEFARVKPLAVRVRRLGIVIRCASTNEYWIFTQTPRPYSS